MEQRRTLFALLVCCLITAAACSGESREQRAVEHVEQWLTPDTVFVVQPAGERVSAELVDGIDEFVALAPAATIWPSELPEGTTIERGFLSFAVDDGPRLLALFRGPDAVGVLQWQVSTGERRVGTSAEHFVVGRGGVIVARTDFEFTRWTIEAAGCGHTLLAGVTPGSPLTSEEALRSAEGVLDFCEPD